MTEKQISVYLGTEIRACQITVALNLWWWSLCLSLVTTSLLWGSLQVGGSSWINRARTEGSGAGITQSSHSASSDVCFNLLPKKDRRSFKVSEKMLHKVLYRDTPKPTCQRSIWRHDWMNRKGTHTGTGMKMAKSLLNSSSGWDKGCEPSEISVEGDQKGNTCFVLTWVLLFQRRNKPFLEHIAQGKCGPGHHWVIKYSTESPRWKWKQRNCGQPLLQSSNPTVEDYNAPGCAYQEEGVGGLACGDHADLTVCFTWPALSNLSF